MTLLRSCQNPLNSMFWVLNHPIPKPKDYLLGRDTGWLGMAFFFGIRDDGMTGPSPNNNKALFSGELYFCNSVSFFFIIKKIYNILQYSKLISLFSVLLNIHTLTRHIGHSN